MTDPTRGYDRLLFVAAGIGFLSGELKTLHPDLLDDLDELGVDHGRVVNVKSIRHTNFEIQEAANCAALVTAATNALHELVGEAFRCS